MYTIIITSVLLFSALVNSLQTHWMRQRLARANDPNSEYVSSFVGPPAQANSPQGEARNERYKQFYSTLLRAYGDNSYVVRVPLLGVTFDVNDLGLIGGVTLVILLLTMRFVLSREGENLRLAFREAASLGQVEAFYRLLAMRQVLTVPPGTAIDRTWLVRWTPKVFIGLPLFVQVCVTTHDVWTASIGFQVTWSRTCLLLLSEIFLLGCIIVLTWIAVRQLVAVDSMWEDEWTRLRPSPPGQIIQDCQREYSRLVYEELPRVQAGAADPRLWFNAYWGHQFNQWTLWKRGDIDALTFSLWMFFRHAEWMKNERVGGMSWQEGWESALASIAGLKETDFAPFMRSIFNGTQAMLRPFRYAQPDRR